MIPLWSILGWETMTVAELPAQWAKTEADMFAWAA